MVDCGVFLEFIPGGYTWKLQVLDVGVNKPFKNHIQDSYNTWFGLNNYDIKPQRSDVAHWVTALFDAVEKAIILKTWERERVGITATAKDVEIDKIDHIYLCFELLGINELTQEEEEEVEKYYNNYTLDK